MRSAEERKELAERDMRKLMEDTGFPDEYKLPGMLSFCISLWLKGYLQGAVDAMNKTKLMLTEVKMDYDYPFKGEKKC